MPARRTKKDANQIAASNVCEVTGTKRARVSELLNSPELRKKYREAKKKLVGQTKKTG